MPKTTIRSFNGINTLTRTEKMPSQKSAPSVYQLKVTLKHSKPPIWRRLQVTADTTLYELHIVLQVAMGWTDSHLHQFIAHGQYYSDPLFELDVIDESRARLSQLVTGIKDKFIYEYDFGDSWEHEILVEKVLTPEAKTHYPRCVKGKRACPPEDCGGVWGYEDFLEAIQDHDHPVHEDLLEWIGGEFDPEAFDVDEVNQVFTRF